jgi:3,4-dihydroxy 2-butanone 4-phosphate synthase/GTP cyclohydrolase II
MTSPLSRLDSIETAIAAIKSGKPVVVIDDEDRENEGDLIFASELATPDLVAFMVRYTSGYICVAVTEADADRLDLPPMFRVNQDRLGTAYTVTVDAREGVTTGISAADRARTVRAATAKHARAEDIVQPGHIFPIMAQNGGVLVRAGHTEAGCDLPELAGLTPASVICEIMNPDGSMARMPELVEFARRHGMKIGTISDLIHHRSQTETLVERIADRQIATAYGSFRLVVYHDKTVDEVHYALVKGDPSPERPALVRVHEPFMSLDLFDFDEARHAFSVQDAMRMVAHQKEGVIVLLRRRDSASEILERLDDATRKRRATTRAWDPRLHGIGAQILKDLNVGKMRVLARPKRIPSMSGFGLEVVEYVSPDDAVAVKAV